MSGLLADVELAGAAVLLVVGLWVLVHLLLHVLEDVEDLLRRWLG